MAGNLRIAKNALFLYSRTIISTVVGIFSLRIMLEALGVEDYGLLNVAGGVLGLFAFITDGLGTATSQYITYELGKEDHKRINDTFCTSMAIFIGLSLIIILLGETVGLWLLKNKLSIPEGRETAAQWVFHLSILGAAISIPQAPYNACMIAHEKFNIIAYVSLLSTFTRLGILYLVIISEYDHLILYAILTFILSTLTLIYSRFYCIRHFQETKLHLRFNRELLKPIIRFSYWEIFGSISRILNGTGFNMIINVFFGVIVNAAIGIGATVSGAVTGLAFTITRAFKPGMVKHYARNDFNQFKNMLSNSSLISMIMYGIFSIPLLVELDYVMTLWLHEIPIYSREICIIQLIANTLLMATLVTAESLKSMGRNKGINMLQCFNSILTISLVTLSIYLDYSIIVVYAVFSLNIIWYFIEACYLMGKHTGWKYISKFIYRTVVKVFIIEIIVYLILQYIHNIIGASFITLVINCILSVILFSVLTFKFILSKPQQEDLRILIKSRYNLSKVIRSTT